MLLRALGAMVYLLSGASSGYWRLTILYWMNLWLSGLRNRRSSFWETGNLVLICRLGR